MIWFGELKFNDLLRWNMEANDLVLIKFLGYLAKILFLDSHAKILQVRTNLDIFMVSSMSRSWQDLTIFSMFLIKVCKVSVNWAGNGCVCVGGGGGGGGGYVKFS